MHRIRIVTPYISVAVAAALVWCSAVAQTASDASLCELETTARVVAIGDVHGAYDAFAALLREAELMNARERWIGGRSVLVQTGDVLDRGPDSRQVIDLLQRLEREALRAGGAVYTLLGNHELMRITGDWRYVSEGEYAAFRGRDSELLRTAALERAQRLALDRARATGQTLDVSALRAELERQIPLGAPELAAGFSASGSYGRWVRERPAVVKINGVVFVHGGISAAAAGRGCAQINDTIATEIAALEARADSSANLGGDDDGPLWYRGLATESEEGFEATLDAILARMEARAIVVGHTTMPGNVTARFGGRVLAIDTGMLGGNFYPRGAPAAIEFMGATVTAVYLDGRRQRLPALAQWNAAEP